MNFEQVFQALGDAEWHGSDAAVSGVEYDSRKREDWRSVCGDARRDDRRKSLYRCGAERRALRQL